MKITRERGGQASFFQDKAFPLIPLLMLRPANGQNTSSFYFHWLFIRIWNLDAVQFELAIVADTHWGIGITGILPYLRWTCCIPCPEKLNTWVYKHLSRKVKQAPHNYFNQDQA